MTALVGSLFSGTGAMDLAVCEVLGATVAWHCETESAACRVLAHHWPGVPNLGDIAAVDWADVEPVDILTAGVPCQDVSSAGRRAGMGPGTRSGLWTHATCAIDVLRPRLVVIENVRGLLSADAACDLEPCPWCVGDDEGRPLRALGRVLGDLADIGFDARWCGLRAADVGAPHGRFRVFLVAWPAADTSGAGWGWHEPVPVARNGRAPVRSGQAQPGRRDSDAAADPDRSGREGAESAAGRDLPARGAAADPDRIGPVRGGEPWGEGRPEPAGQLRGPDPALNGDAATPDATCSERRGPEWEDLAAAWGVYGPAVQRWELILGWPAPAPTQTGTRGGRQLSPPFVEWLMGLPSGWVTAVPGLSRNEQLKLLGNGVVPQQCAVAVRELLRIGAVTAP